MMHYLEGKGFINLLVYICVYFIAVVRANKAEGKGNNEGEQSLRKWTVVCSEYEWSY